MSLGMSDLYPSVYLCVCY